ncbi:MAG: serine acetyltransferase [Oscillospiraceae bacterium]|nr:serine acetyltransferase [Oscillospiraceae bacterium]
MNERILAEITRVAETITARQESTRELPSKEIVVACLEKLRYILFPGYFEAGRLTPEVQKARLVVLLQEVASSLEAQIHLAGQHHGPTCGAHLEQSAEEITLAFVEKLPEVMEYLATDIEALYQGDPAAYSRCEVILSYPGLYATMVYRIAHELYLLKVPMIPRLMTEHAHSVTGIDIHPGAQIGRYFCMDHGTGIVIGETTVIGEHVKLYQGVTLGALSTKDGQGLKQVKRHPTIQDHVTVYAGATILGGDTVIGEYAVVGGNSFVVKSVPGHTSVRMVPPELQYKES